MNNEQREQQMMNSANLAESNSRTIDLSKKQVFMSAYIQGWKAADSHPAWVSVLDELPPHRNQTNHKFENDFSVNCFVSDGKDVDTGYYDYRLRKWNCEFLTDVVYWYCPQLPRKED